MFSKNKQEPSRSATSVPQKPAVPSIISADLTITGDLASEGEVQIDGAVNGDIKTTTLLIGETAHIRGQVHAKRVRVHGRVDGQITAQSVTLAKTAHVSGDVTHEDLSIEKGAFLEGHCMRMAEAKVDTKPDGSSTTVPKVELGTDSSHPPVPQKPVIHGRDKPTSMATKPDAPSNGSGKTATA